MAVYKSAETDLPTSAENVYSKVSNLENLKTIMDKIPKDQIPADKLQAFESVEVTPDTISFPAGPVGNLIFKVTEKVPSSLIKLDAEGSPIPLSLSLHLTPINESSSKGHVEINIEIPALLKPMIGSQIQKMTDQFGDMLKALATA